MSRPTSSQHHRLSVGGIAASLPARPAMARPHSHSISSGAVGRVNRRKSSTFAPSASAAISAAVESAMADGSASVHRRGSSARAALAVLNDVPYLSLPGGHSEPSASAVIDGPALSTFQGIDRAQKPKMRRASDGTRLTKKEKAAAGDLKCEHCGKAYKHGSCLNKHLWEHTPQWQVTSKLLISKHQQVQLLEAASVLVQMNGDPPAPADSDGSSPSPAASGSSDREEDEYSSAETTPPPHTAASYRDVKRHSGASSAYSRSYQSGVSESMPVGAFSHYRNWSTSSVSRPATAATSIAESYRDEDPQDLAAAVGLLSCSYGTPKLGPSGAGADVPPVPPLPAKYAYASSPLPRQVLAPQQQQSQSPLQLSQHQHRPQDVNMDDDDDDDEDEDDEAAAAARHRGQHHQQPAQYARYPLHEEEEGMFGSMDA